MDDEVGALSRALAIATLQLELEYIYGCLEDEALDIGQGTQNPSFLLSRQVSYPASLAPIPLSCACLLPTAHLCSVLCYCSASLKAWSSLSRSQALASANDWKASGFQEKGRTFGCTP